MGTRSRWRPVFVLLLANLQRDEMGHLATHVLVVDDDLDVLTVLVAVLNDSGFVTTAADGADAMRDMLSGKGVPIDVIVLDCQMPGEPLAQLALHAKALRFPVVMISGNWEAMNFALENGLQLLPKPFRVADLLIAISEAMSSGEFGQRDA